MEKLPTHALKAEVAEVIEAMEAATSLAAIVGVKKLKGYRNAYRIRVGDFRIGFYKNGEVIEFARILNRRDIYKLFP